MKQYSGSIVSLALATILAATPLYGVQWPLWTIGPIVGVFLVVGYLLRPSKSAPPTPASSPRRDTAFVRGDADGSTFDDIVVDGAHAVIDGNARNAVFHNVRYRAAAAKRLFGRR